MIEQEIQAKVVPTPRAGSAASGEAAQPGVGVCLSGGGSRAMTAGLGQLRALHHLTVDGENLLSKVVALSTVSGGSWLSVPWTFLPPDVSDHDFLGEYREPENLTPALLTTLAPNSPGRNIDSGFSLVDLFIEAIGLRLFHGTPFNSMWQILMGRHLLKPYNLYVAGGQAEPTSTFSLDQASKAEAMTGPNPGLSSRVVHLVADGNRADRTPRAHLMCNSAVFVSEPESQVEFLAPVVFTPTQAGVRSTPPGVTVADTGTPVGGGTVDAFAFGSALAARTGDQVEVLQERQLALADIVGLSSAAFAETVQNLGEDAIRESPRQHRRFVRERLRIERALHTSTKKASLWHRIVDWVRAWLMHWIVRRLSPRELVPRYRYWPIGGSTPDPAIKAARFADGGSLENTGIASMLTNPAVDRIIACVNSETPLRTVQHGIVDEDGAGHVSQPHDTAIEVAGELAFLFGYQAHSPNDGYVRFAGTPDKELGAAALFKHNHVFESHSFAELLRGLAAAAGDGLRSGPVVFQQDLRTIHNDWFGVTGGRCVTVVWVYLNPVDEWTKRLPTDSQIIVSDTKGFPNYSTFATQRSATEFNLLSDQTAWSLVCDSSASIMTGVFDHQPKC